MRFPRFSSSKEVYSCYLIFLLLICVPVFDELHRGGVAEGGVQPRTVVEHLNVFEGGGLHRLPAGEAFPEVRSFLTLLNQLSVGALSQQLPLRLIEQSMSYLASFS